MEIFKVLLSPSYKMCFEIILLIRTAAFDQLFNFVVV